MASPIQSGWARNFVGFRQASGVDLASGGVITSGNTNRLHAPHTSGYWMSFRPGRTINGLTTMTRARYGTPDTMSNGAGNVFLLDACQSFSVTDQVPIATVAEGSGTTPTANALDVAYIHTISGFDRIPNFALVSPGSGLTTRVSTQSGLWSATSTWSGGTVPLSGEIVRVYSGNGVIYDVSGATLYTTVSVENYGGLTFWTSGSTLMNVVHFQVRELGLLRIGSSGAPIASGKTAVIQIGNVPLNSGYDPYQYGNGLIVLGTLNMYGQDRGLSYIKVGSGSISGATSLLLWSGPSSWYNGDRLVVPDTRQTTNQASHSGWAASGCWEVRAFASGSANTLYFNSGLTYQHAVPAGEDGTYTSGLRFHVMNLTRNVVLRSANASGTPGHFIKTAHAQIDVRNTQVIEMGRTIASGLNNTTTDLSGNVTNYGMNQIGRYPIHFHHCGGRQPVEVSGANYQYVLMGNAVDGGDTTHNRKWGVTVHGTHWGLVENNAVYNVFGGGYVFEDGTETENIVQRNMVCRVPGLFLREDNDDPTAGFARNGAGFWMRAGLNQFRDNVSANCGIYGMVWNAIFLGSVNCPTFPGAHLHAGSIAGSVTCNGYSLGSYEFAGFETYGYQSAAMTYWWFCSSSSVPEYAAARGVFDRVWTWHNTQYAAYAYENSKLTLNDWIARGDYSLLHAGNGATNGIWPSDYMSHQAVYVGCDFQGFCIGVEVTTFGIDSIQVTDCLFRAAEGVRWNLPGFPSSAAFSAPLQLPRKVLIRSSDLTVVSGTVPTYTNYEVRGNFIQTGLYYNYAVQNDLYVYDRNSVSGASSRLFSYFQSGGSYLTQTLDGNYIGCVESGLTNQQAHDKYNPWTPGDSFAGPSVKSDNPNPNTPGLCYGGSIVTSGAVAMSWHNCLATSG